MLKITLKGKEARDKIKKGIDFCADIVRSTLGPGGRNVIIEMAQQWPAITNDGVTIAKKIEVEDETENLAILTLVNAAHKTNEAVGDGTTTAITIAQKIIDEGFRRIDDFGENSLLDSRITKRTNAMSLKREVEKNCELVIKELKETAKPINNQTELENVCIAAIENEKLGKAIGEMVWKIGIDGFIDVQDSYKGNLETEIIEGMKFYGKYADDFMITDERSKEAIFRDAPVLVTNFEINSVNQIKNLIKQITNQNVSAMVVFAPDFRREFITAIWNSMNLKYKYPNGVIAPFTMLAVKTKSLTSEQLEDIAVYTGAFFFDKDKDSFLEKAELNQLGKAEKIVTGNERTVIIGGKGDQEIIKVRIENLKKQREKEGDDLFAKKLDRRIAALSSGIGIIRVGSETDIEKNYLRYKIEDVISAAKAALEEGVIEGGGLALKKIAEKLPQNILTDALKAPYYQIQENAGEELEITDNIIDPVKVTRTALENACSVAGTILTIEGSIAIKRRKLIEELQNTINPTKEELWDNRLPQRDEQKYETSWLNNKGDY